MQVKICGITEALDAQAAARAGADFIGLILAPSARGVTAEAAREIIRTLPPTTRPVLVFRNQPVEVVVDVLALTGTDWVQLHGHEPVEYLHSLRKRRPGLNLIRAWEIHSHASATALLSYLDGAACAGVPIRVALLDAPKGAAHPGYELLGDCARLLTRRPPRVWCAGGLTAANVGTATAVGGYDGVDVASGVESRPGIKDHAAIRDFITAARRGT